MSDVFESYEDEFEGLARDIAKKISHASTYETNPNEKLDELNFLKMKLAQLKDLTKQMDIEVRGQEDAGMKRELSEKAAQHKATLASLQKDHTESVRQAEENVLLGTGGSGAVSSVAVPAN